MFVGKVGAYPSEAPFVKSFIGLALGLFNKTNCSVELLSKMEFFLLRRVNSQNSTTLNIIMKMRVK